MVRLIVDNDDDAAISCCCSFVASESPGAGSPPLVDVTSSRYSLSGARTWRGVSSAVSGGCGTGSGSGGTSATEDDDEAASDGGSGRATSRRRCCRCSCCCLLGGTAGDELETAADRDVEVELRQWRNGSRGGTSPQWLRWTPAGWTRSSWSSIANGGGGQRKMKPSRRRMKGRHTVQVLSLDNYASQVRSRDVHGGGAAISNTHTHARERVRQTVT